MYKSERHSLVLDLNSTRDNARYDEILNNPLCAILSEKLEKVSEREFTEDGKMMSNDRLLRVITWEEKVLL